MHNNIGLFLSLDEFSYVTRTTLISDGERSIIL